MGKKILNKIKVTPLKIINMPAGNIMRALSKNELRNWTFGEAYFSKVKFGKIKAWKFHTKMTLNLIVPLGKVKFVFYSKKDDAFKVITIGEKKYSRLKIPPRVWFGFKGISKKESIIMNLTDLPHDKKEVLRYKKSEINFKW